MTRKKRYRPRNLLRDPVTFVLNRAKGDSEQMLKAKTRNHAALQQFTRGTATPSDWAEVDSAMLMARALDSAVFSGEYTNDIAAAKVALDDAWARYQRLGSLGFTGPQLQAVNHAMDVHDAQLEQVTTDELMRAARAAKEGVRP